MQLTSASQKNRRPKASRTGDLVRIGNEAEVWEVFTLWDSPDGTPMATLERFTGGKLTIRFSHAADVQPIT